MYEKGFFRNLPLMVGAKETIEHLINDHHLDVHIASKPIPNGFCPSEKFEWVAEHLPALLKKTHLVQDKGLLLGDYLVDDDLRWKPRFRGHMFHFNSDKPQDCWKSILEYMKKYRVGK
jgi:5'(3')-deoxyribonucleotidase